MRNAAHISPRSESQDGSDTIPKAQPSHHTTPEQLPQAVLGARSLRDHLPPWLGGRPVAPDPTELAFEEYAACAEAGC